MPAPVPPRRPPALLACLCALLLAACDGDNTPPLDAEALRDPETCRSCHPDHVRQWSGSMHAYASDDPVFLAMNARGQRETGGQLGAFCVRCHAPMALRLDATTDGLNLASVPRPLRGVTCAFCHQVDAVLGTHNNPLRLASDGVLRGGIADPVRTGAHRAAYSPLHDRDQPDSAGLCGSCHDVVTPRGFPLERTFAEWQTTIFAAGPAAQRLSCGGCHMSGTIGLAAQVPGARTRLVHDHAMPGLDVALTPFPETEAQRQGILRDLGPTLGARLCVTPDTILVSLDNIGAGHAWPSGATQDRRAWVDITAYSGDREILRSGAFAEGQPIRPDGDPRLFQMRSLMRGDAGQEVHMFWEAASYQSTLLPPAVTLDPRDPRFFHAVEHRYPLMGQTPDRVVMRVRVRPLPLELLDDLAGTGDLDPAVRAKVPTFDLKGTELTWLRADQRGCVPE